MGEKTVRCKFEIDEIAKTRYGASKLRASPVYSNDENSENRKFWEATPSGSLEVSCVREEAISHLKPGDKIYIDITIAPQD